MKQTAVDKYMKTNRRLAEMESYPDMRSLFKEVDQEEFDLFYSVDMSDFDKELIKVRSAAYRKIDKEKLTIIYECPCRNVKKVNHHFNYEFPNYVLRLCYSCHMKEHSRLKGSLATSSQEIAV